jgi:hypothetical protein
MRYARQAATVFFCLLGSSGFAARMMSLWVPARSAPVQRVIRSKPTAT